MKIRETIKMDGDRVVYRRLDLPTIVCLCGSTRFYPTFQKANYQETMAGKIVLSIGFYPADDDDHHEERGCTPEQKQKLDALYLKKIDLADEILVLNVGGYVGDSTMSEIAYAILRDKKLRFWEAPVGGIDSWMFNNCHTLGRLITAMPDDHFPGPNSTKTSRSTRTLRVSGKRETRFHFIASWILGPPSVSNPAGATPRKR